MFPSVTKKSISKIMVSRDFLASYLHENEVDE